MDFIFRSILRFFFFDFFVRRICSKHTNGNGYNVMQTETTFWRLTQKHLNQNQNGIGVYPSNVIGLFLCSLSSRFIVIGFNYRIGLFGVPLCMSACQTSTLFRKIIMKPKIVRLYFSFFGMCAYAFVCPFMLVRLLQIMANEAKAIFVWVSTINYINGYSI